MGGTAYAIAGGKGGVGKTTTAINVGVVLAQSGHEVVVVDADLAMANLGQELGIEHEPTLQQVLAGDAPVRDAVVAGPGGLAALPGDRNLDGFAAADPSELTRVIDLLTVAYDIVLVDTGPGLQRDAFITYRQADGVVLVTTPHEVAVDDANRTAAMAADADCPAIGAVVTRADSEEPAATAALDTDVLSIVPEHRTGGPVTASQPDSDAASAYRELAASLPVVERDAVIPDEPADEPHEEPDDGPSDETTADVETPTEESTEAADESERTADGHMAAEGHVVAQSTATGSADEQAVEESPAGEEREDTVRP